jgi:hypothetical protein
MEEKQRKAQETDLASLMNALAWRDRFGQSVFPTRSSFEWFVKQRRPELVKAGALIPGRGRSGSLVASDRMSKVVVKILRRRALDKAA